MMGIFVVFFCIGAAVGSFLNVCADRMPKNMSIVSPRSHCVCGKSIPFKHNIPIVSWLLLRGRAECCAAKIPSRYFVVEMVTALMFCAMKYIFADVIVSSCFCVFTSLLILISIIDMDTMLIPDVLSVGGVCAGFILSCLVPQIHNTDSALYSGLLSLTGVVIGSGVLFWIGEIGEILFKKESIGIGDIKLIGLIGAFLGARGAIYSIFLGSFAGVMFILLAVLLKKHKIKLDARIPFAPLLSVGSLMWLML
ncbi:MAG: prepilin peptidase [Sphingobacteriia bacterium]|nr:prepilin peptidase [Sphingobacteriia bacterium]